MSTRRSLASGAGALALALATVGPATVGPATAHHLVVIPPSGHTAIERWVGGPALPGQGRGLVPGGPPGAPIVQSPAHAGGLVTACEALRVHGNAAADIFGPPTPAGCPHGT